MKTTALPSPSPARPRTVLVGSLLGTGAAVVAFCTLIAVYVQQRQQTQSVGEEWFPADSIELGPAGLMMVTLLLSTITVQWAVQAARSEDRPHEFIALGTTLLFGAAVLNQFWFVYQNTGFAIDDSSSALLFYAVTGSFIAMLIAAMAALVIVTVRSLIGTLGDELAHIVQSAAIFWHATVLCYALVWYVVFVTK